ncbi:hypothetical protein NEUTE2DRAFT_73010, partial [Neurospora tetrasperma FGSC 2509]
FKYITVIVNKLTKIRYYIPVEILIADKLTKRFIDKVFALYRLQNIIVLDRRS